jgi:hypothetical protein
MQALAVFVQCRGQLVQTATTGPNNKRGTWVHYQVALHLAQLCPPRFALAVSEAINQVVRQLKGTELAASNSAGKTTSQPPSLVECLVHGETGSQSVITKIRESDEYANTTKLCQAATKKWANFYENESAKLFPGELASIIQDSWPCDPSHQWQRQAPHVGPPSDCTPSGTVVFPKVHPCRHGPGQQVPPGPGFSLPLFWGMLLCVELNGSRHHIGKRGGVNKTHGTPFEAQSPLMAYTV